MVQRLLELKGDRAINVNEKTSWGQTGLDVAIEEGHTEVAETIRAAKRLCYQGESDAAEVSENDKCVCSAFVFQPSWRFFADLI